MEPLDLKALLANRNAAVLLHETEYDPASGAGAPVAPATYAGEEQKRVYLAEAEHAIIPTADDGGFHVEVLRDEADRPVIAPSVILSSVAAESSRMDEALWRANVDAGLDIPAIIVDPAPDTVIEKVLRDKLEKSTLPAAGARAEAARAQLQNLSLNSVTLPHRHVDGWIRAAIDPLTGRQVWAGGEAEDGKTPTLYQRISTAGEGNHVELLRLNPTALLGGFWLSTGAAQRHKRARAISASITGYDAHRMSARATKLDSLPVSVDSTKVTVDEDGISVTERKGTAGANQNEKDGPSAVGLGQVPGGAAVRVTCASILGSTTITLSSLRSVLRGEDVDQDYRAAAQEMLLSLALLARVRADEDTYIRSECSLVDTASRWGVRIRGSRTVTPLDVDPARLEDLAHEAVNRARKLGVIAGSHHVTMSEPEVQVVVDGFLPSKGKS